VLTGNRRKIAIFIVRSMAVGISVVAVVPSVGLLFPPIVIMAGRSIGRIRRLARVGTVTIGRRRQVRAFAALNISMGEGREQ
jgi:hypothetical protein